MSDSNPDLKALQAFLNDCRQLVVLSGAGISTGSGIPTYRDAEGAWRANEPIKHQEFINSHERRQRYWARSMRGWPGVRDARPNGAHRALALLESRGYIDTIITQNVDRLHQRAGSSRVIDLHGRLDKVICLDCRESQSRESVQRRLERDNPGASATGFETRPDGDSDVPDHVVSGFRTPDCERCGGTLMPDVVFFGGTVPKQRVEDCMAAVDRSQGLLVVGSSLTVYSGFRFCRRAHDKGKPIALINPGKSRADELAALRLASPCEPVLSDLIAGLAVAENPKVANAESLAG